MRYSVVENALLRIYNCAIAHFQPRYCAFSTALLRISGSPMGRFRQLLDGRVRLANRAHNISPALVSPKGNAHQIPSRPSPSGKAKR